MYKFSKQVTSIYYCLLQFNSHFNTSSATRALLTPLQVQTAAKVRNQKRIWASRTEPSGQKTTAASKPCIEPTSHRFVLLKVKIAWHFSSSSLARRQYSWHQGWHAVHTAAPFPGHCRNSHCKTSENLHWVRQRIHRAREKLLTALEESQTQRVHQCRDQHISRDTTMMGSN